MFWVSAAKAGTSDNGSTTTKNTTKNLRMESSMVVPSYHDKRSCIMIWSQRELAGRRNHETDDVIFLAIDRRHYWSTVQCKRMRIPTTAGICQGGAGCN